jgi:hypothetical protein
MSWIDHYDKPKEADCERCGKHMNMEDELALVRAWSKLPDERFYNLAICNQCRRERHDRLVAKLEREMREYDEHFTDDHGYWGGG